MSPYEQAVYRDAAEAVAEAIAKAARQALARECAGATDATTKHVFGAAVVFMIRELEEGASSARSASPWRRSNREGGCPRRARAEGGAVKFAAQTDVPVERSRAEIERLISRYGADGFMSGWLGNRATVQFRLADRNVRFVMELPDRAEDRFTLRNVNQSGAKTERSPDAARQAWEQACRQKWRALALLVKAKLEAVDANIATLEEAFFADIVLPDGLTVYEKARGQVALAYSGQDVPLLPAGLYEK